MTTVATCTKAEDAHLVRALLEGSGVTAYLRDELQISVDLGASLALGGIKVDVNDEDAARAHEIIASANAS